MKPMSRSEYSIMLMQVPKRIISGQPRIRNREESLIEMIRYKMIIRSNSGK